MKCKRLFEYRGNVHIHSSCSDGKAGLDGIVDAALEAGLDFICLNDHAYMTDSLHLEKEGFYKNLAVMVGLEIGTRFHHYLAFDLKEMVRADTSPPQAVISRVNAQGGFGFLAHPFEKGMPFKENSVAYTWNDLTVTGYAGIEIWNFSSRWKERVKSVFHGLFFLMFKASLLKGPSRRTLAFWDDSGAGKRVAGIGGSDAHGALFHMAGRTFIPLTYPFLLNSIDIHILLEKQLSGNFDEAKGQIYHAIKEGRLYVANDALRSAEGFRFHYLSDRGIRTEMGCEVSFEPGILFVELLEKSEIRVIKDGTIVLKWRGKKVEQRVDTPGVYRIEVRTYRFPFGWRPWIFSNPVYLR